jgi:hypothetical protein
MGMGQREFASLIQVTLEAGLGVSPGIDDRAQLSTRLVVEATRPVTGFAADILGVIPFCHQSGMRRVMKTGADLSVALHAGLGPYEFGPQDHGRIDDGPLHHDAGDKH